MKGVLARMRLLTQQIHSALLESGVALDERAEDTIFNALRKFFQV